MADPRENPFKFGDPVDGAYYLDRPELRSAVANLLENRIHAILIGPRRFGKTSFTLDLIGHLESRRRACLYVDIFNVTSHRDFLLQLLRGFRRKKSWGKKLAEWIESIPRLRPKLTWDADPATGGLAFSVSPEIATERDIKETIQDTVGALGEIGEKVIVAIDEFQKVAELDDRGWLEATLRTQMQQLRNTSFLFTGSRKSVIRDMIDSPARPFYRSCQPIEFPSFGEEFTDWVIGRFRSVGIACDRSAIQMLRRRVQETPNYVQMACFHLVAQGVTRIDDGQVENALRTIVRQNSYAYQTLLNSLTPVQQRALRLAARQGEQVFAKELLQEFEIPSGPALASAIKSLKRKQVLDEGTAKGKVVFDDPLFAIWLRTEFGEC